MIAGLPLVEVRQKKKKHLKILNRLVENILKENIERNNKTKKISYIIYMCTVAHLKVQSRHDQSRLLTYM